MGINSAALSAVKFSMIILLAALASRFIMRCWHWTRGRRTQAGGAGIAKQTDAASTSCTKRHKRVGISAIWSSTRTTMIQSWTKNGRANASHSVARKLYIKDCTLLSCCCGAGLSMPHVYYVTAIRPRADGLQPCLHIVCDSDVACLKAHGSRGPGTERRKTMHSEWTSGDLKSCENVYDWSVSCLPGAAWTGACLPRRGCRIEGDASRR